MPTRVIFGPGAISQASKVAGTEESRVLVVCSPSMRRLRIADRIVDDIDTGRSVLFDEAVPYPTPEMVDRVVDLCRSAGAWRVIEVNGQEAPLAWILPSDNRDPHAVERLVHVLLRTGVELHVAEDDLSADGREWPSVSIPQSSPHCCAV